MFFVIVKFKGEEFDKLLYHSGTDCYTEHCAPIFITEEDAVDYLDDIDDSESFRIVGVNDKELKKIKGLITYERQKEEE